MERKVCGLHALGSDKQRISQVCGLSVEEVEEILVDRKKVEEKVEKKDDEDLKNISELLVKIGEENLTAIIRRAAELRQGRCLD